MANNIRFIFGTKLWGKFRKGNNDSIEDSTDSTTENQLQPKQPNYQIYLDKDINIIKSSRDANSSKNISVGGTVGEGDGVRRISIKDQEKAFELEQLRSPYYYLFNNTTSDDNFFEALVDVAEPNDMNLAGKCQTAAGVTWCYPEDTPPAGPGNGCRWCQAPDPNNPGKCISKNAIDPCQKCTTTKRSVSISRSGRTGPGGVPLPDDTLKIDMADGEKFKPSSACKAFNKECRSCITATNEQGDIVCAAGDLVPPTECSECINSRWVGCERFPGSTGCVDGECKFPDNDCPEPCQPNQCQACVHIDPDYPRKGKTCKSQCTDQEPHCVPIFPNGFVCICKYTLFGQGCPPDKPDFDSSNCSCHCEGSEPQFTLPGEKTPAQACNETNGKVWDDTTCSCVSRCTPPCTGCTQCVFVDGSWECREIGQPNDGNGNALALNNEQCRYFSQEQFDNLLP